MKEFQLNDKKVITGWAFFDWANSVYFLVIATAIFPIYYGAVAPETVSLFGIEILSESAYSYAVGFAYLLVAALTPLLSGVADYGGRRKFFLKLFTVVGSAACVILFFFTNDSLMWLGLSMFIVATIGGAGGIVFYNAYLPEIASEDMYDKVSAKGYVYGYFGSVLLLILCLLLILKPDWFGITSDTLPSRISFVLVGVWWLGFAQITFRRLPPDNPVRTPGLLKKGWDELKSVWNKVKHESNTVRFLTSFFFYSAGVQTVIYLATIFASIELGFEDTQLIITVLILQIVAMLGAWLFALVSGWRGNKVALLIQIAIWMLICVGAYFVQNDMQFYVIAALVGLVLGGIQSISRSTYAKLITDAGEDMTSHFSFYDVLFKVSVVAGSVLFGVVNQLTGSMRNSVLALIVLFAIGMWMMMKVKVDET